MAFLKTYGLPESGNSILMALVAIFFLPDSADQPSF